MEEYNCFLSDLTKARVGTFIRSFCNEPNRLNLAYTFSTEYKDSHYRECVGYKIHHSM